MRAIQPIHDGYVERDGVRIFYEVFGAGEPTVLLLPTWSIIHSRHWKMQIPYLSRHCRVLTFDGRGNGRSDRPSEPEAYAESEFAGSLDPPNCYDSRHRTHQARTHAAAANGLGVSGVAPGVRLVSIRGGQDSGYLFLDPVINALTYGADIGVDVINMSFYVDPWLYNCTANPADSPSAPRHRQRTESSHG